MSAEPEPTVTIPIREYMDLFKDSATLAGLESAGVDNWEGYGEVDWDQIDADCQTERERLAGESS